MSKGSKSRVVNKKQYDDNFDKIKKIPPSESKLKKSKEMIIPLSGGKVTRYTFS